MLYCQIPDGCDAAYPVRYIINMNNIPMKHTIELMKNRNQLQQKNVDFIKNADLYMDNFEYVDMDQIRLTCFHL